MSELTETETDSQELAVSGMDSDGSEAVQRKRCRLGKVFRDPVHGHIELDPLLVKIIDTPQFQRLRNIKQLGGNYFVYPGASHNRFEHSIGVAHLAGEFVETLKKQQPDLGITNDDVLCVTVAGLCHDLGHGPFSHVFDGYFIKEARRKYPDIVRKKWQHEDASAEMFDHLLEKNGLLSELPFQDERGEKNRAFIKEMITGKPFDPITGKPIDPITGKPFDPITGKPFDPITGKPFDPITGKPVPLGHETEQPSVHNWTYRGREERMSFLYEIIANKESGIDVDKWDYFERDCYYTGLNCNFDMRRTMKLARVIKIPEDKNLRHICIRDKEAFNLYQMFHTRFSLYKRAYKHPTVNGIELMIRDALIAADKHLEIPGKPIEAGDGEIRDALVVPDVPGKPNEAGVGKCRPCRMSQAIDDMYAYTLLTDCVVQQILMSPDDSLKQAKKLLHRIQTRELYKCVVNRVWEIEGEPISHEQIEAMCRAEGIELKEDAIVVDVATFNYGMKSDNPIDHVWFYTKKKPDAPKRIKREEISALLPETFQEKYIRIYFTEPARDSAKESAVQKCFDTWYEKQSKLRPQETPPRRQSPEQATAEQNKALPCRRKLDPCRVPS